MPLDAYEPISLIMLMAGMMEGQEQSTRMKVGLYFLCRALPDKSHFSSTQVWT